VKNEETAYMGTKQSAELWGVSQATVSKWCREGKIPGAEQDKPGSPWRIPSNAKKPK
jgi:excisionase family DNA binding protein